MRNGAPARGGPGDTQIINGLWLLQDACRVESFENYTHQADIILRKCVSSSISDHTGKFKVIENGTS